MQPLVASSANTVPFWLPTKTQPPITVGCAQADVASGNPNAHFNSSCGSCAAVSCALAADCSLVFAKVAPQPFHAGLDVSLNCDAVAQRPISAPVESPASAVPPRHSAMARRSGPLREAP